MSVIPKLPSFTASQVDLSIVRYGMGVRLYPDIRIGFSVARTRKTGTAPISFFFALTSVSLTHHVTSARSFAFEFGVNVGIHLNTIKRWENRR